MTREPADDDVRVEYYQTSSRWDGLLQPSQTGQQQHSSSITPRVWLFSILAAVGFLALSTIGSAKYFYAKGRTSALAAAYSDGAGDLSTNLQVIAESQHPHQGDDVNAKDTDICTGDTTLPVLLGVDLVAYFSLEESESAVFGSEDYASTYNGYLFYFSSAENQELFEVGGCDQRCC